MSELHHPVLTGPQRSAILRRAAVVGLIVLILLGAGAGTRLFIRNAQSRQLDTAVKAMSKQHVVTIRPTAGTEIKYIELPGTLQGFIESPIYARSNGYLLRWFKDIGNRVKKGEPLAEIDTPEVDQQLAQAIASRHQSSANLELARSSLDRWEQMRQRDVVSQQELDERRSAFAQQQANLTAADADVQRLQNLVAFKRVIAPFSGLITRRNVDVGDLIVPGNGDTTKALFVLSQTDPLRVYVYVPQAYAAIVKVGKQVDISQNEMPGQIFHGKIERTAGAIDMASRTLQIEVVLPNSDARLMPGAYVKVTVPTDGAKNLTIPSNALLFRSEGARVAIVDSSSKVHLHPVFIGQDFGNTLEIVEGAKPEDQLVLNPPDSLADGDIVVATEKVEKGTPLK